MTKPKLTVDPVVPGTTEFSYLMCEPKGMDRFKVVRELTKEELRQVLLQEATEDLVSRKGTMPTWKQKVLWWLGGFLVRKGWARDGRDPAQPRREL